MQVDSNVLRILNESVLCWLATSSLDGEPNVSPKEIFCLFGDDSLIIANIASPKTARNIKENPCACVCFVNVFTQKGYQITGAASILKQGDADYEEAKGLLEEMTEGKFPFKSVFRIMVELVSEVNAPRYRLFPETTESDQIASSIDTYRVHEYLQ